MSMKRKSLNCTVWIAIIMLLRLIDAFELKRLNCSIDTRKRINPVGKQQNSKKRVPRCRIWSTRLISYSEI